MIYLYGKRMVECGLERRGKDKTVNKRRKWEILLTKRKKMFLKTQNSCTFNAQNLQHEEIFILFVSICMFCNHRRIQPKTKSQDYSYGGCDMPL